MSESKTPVPPEPSDSERAEWREATENYVAWLETELAAKDAELKALNETHGIQLAAISTACIQNTDASVRGRIGRDNPYWTVAYGDVCVAVDREMRERERAENADRELAEITAERDRLREVFQVPATVTDPQFIMDGWRDQHSGALLRLGELERELAELRQRDTCGREELSDLRAKLAASCDKQKLTAIVRWLETNQPDVFRRGLWDAMRQESEVRMSDRCELCGGEIVLVGDFRTTKCNCIKCSMETRNSIQKALALLRRVEAGESVEIRKRDGEWPLIETDAKGMVAFLGTDYSTQRCANIPEAAAAWNGGWK